jgi:hypothetical protein
MSDPQFHRDHREHGGAPEHLDDDLLAEITEDERVHAGLDDFNPAAGAGVCAGEAPPSVRDNHD